MGKSTPRHPEAAQQQCPVACLPERYGFQRPAVAVENCRGIGKKDLPLNDATPEIKVDPDTYRVWANGQLLTCEPAKVLPMAQRFILTSGEGGRRSWRPLRSIGTPRDGRAPGV